jgi:MFS family permease
MGLATSFLLVRDTSDHALHESRRRSLKALPPLRFRQVFWLTSWRNRSLFAICQTGLTNNLNDGMAWGLLPLYFSSQGLPLAGVGTLGALYPAVWGFAQLATGWLSDRMGRKRLIVGGMLLQAAAIASFVMTRGFSRWAAAVVVLGVGTAMVYPALLAAIGDIAHPSWRATSVGVYRLWRDAGYAFGALVAGAVADRLGMAWAVYTVAALTAVSGVVTAALLDETLENRKAI